MRRARSRALTHNEEFIIENFDTVEMRRARSRALTHFNCHFSHVLFWGGRNEKSPFKGIDTRIGSSKARVSSSRNEKSPFKGIDTLQMALESI